MTEKEVVASIVGVAGTGFRLSLILNAVSCEVANVPPEVHSVSKTVHFFALLLNQVAIAFSQRDGVHSESALDLARRGAEYGEKVFSEINLMLDQVKSQREDAVTTSGLEQRFNVVFQKRKITSVLAQLENLRINLHLMLQILQIGQILASTSRYDSPRRVQHISTEMRRERVEAQNSAILLHFQNSELRALWKQNVHQQEELSSSAVHQKDFNELPHTANTSRPLGMVPETQIASQGDSQQLAQPLRWFIDDIEDDWQNMGSSQMEMIQISHRIVDKLLERWTRWKQRRDEADAHRVRPGSAGRHSPVVHDLYDEHDEVPYFERFRERDDNARGYYLEGSTTDWRKPHSMAARQEANRMRKEYAAYQPSISAESSDVEASPSSFGSRKRYTDKHVITSSPESSESETGQTAEPAQKRRSSAAAPPQPPPPKQPPTGSVPLSTPRSFSTTRPSTRPESSLPNNSLPEKSATLNSYSQPQRPWASPDQNSQQHHSVSQPVPPAYNHHTYTPLHINPPPSTGYPSPPPSYQSQQPPMSGPPSRNLAPSAALPGIRTQQQRPASRDGMPPRSPSRLSHSTSATAIPMSQGPSSVQGHSRSRKSAEEKKAHRKEVKRNLGEGATKGLLAGGGIAMFLEALDALAI